MGILTKGDFDVILKEAEQELEIEFRNRVKEEVKSCLRGIQAQKRHLQKIDDVDNVYKHIQERISSNTFNQGGNF